MNLHVTYIFWSTRKQLKALINIEVFVNSYFHSNFNYFPLVWMFSWAKSLNKIGFYKARRYLHEDYKSPFEELLSKSGKATTVFSRLRDLCIEIYKNDIIHVLR